MPSSRSPGNVSGAKSKAGVHARVCGGVMACQGEGGTLAELSEKEIRLHLANHITVGL